MAVVHQLRPVPTEPSDDPDRVNVVRLVEFLGPISPELVLVDPELAPRARALLPELPWNWQPGPRNDAAPITLRLAPSPVVRKLPWRAATVFAVAAVVSVFFGLGLSIAAPGTGEKLALETRPPVATSAPSAVPRAPARPAPASARKPKPKPKPGSPASKPKPKPGVTTSKPKPAASALAPTPPRFVWPTHPGARGYRLALFRNGRRVFERDVTKPVLQLPSTWTFRGRLERLTRGTYGWAVWPLVGKKAKQTQGPAIVSARYVV